MTTSTTQRREAPEILGDSNRITIEGVNALGPLEKAIMDFVWANGPSTVPEIHRYLRDNRKDTAYTTIMMTTTRLYDKGFLKQDRSHQAFIYTSVMNEEEYKDQLVQRVLDELCEYDAEAVLKHVIARMSGSTNNASKQQDQGSPGPPD
jgi:predicted transcriptional regulator